jgi:hypothetical protein
MLLAVEHKRSLQDRHIGDFTPEAHKPSRGGQALTGGSPHKFKPPDKLGIFDMPGVHKSLERDAAFRYKTNRLAMPGLQLEDLPAMGS